MNILRRDLIKTFAALPLAGPSLLNKYNRPSPVQPQKEGPIYDIDISIEDGLVFPVWTKFAKISSLCINDKIATECKWEAIIMEDEYKEYQRFAHIFKHIDKAALAHDFSCCAEGNLNKSIAPGSDHWTKKFPSIEGQIPYVDIFGIRYKLCSIRIEVF